MTGAIGMKVHGDCVIRFSVDDWAAWAPGLETAPSWQAWAQHPFLPEGDQVPALPEIPPMQRRRIERLGRMAIQVACWCEPDESQPSVPMVFASRHGDVLRSMDLLRTLVADEPLSPTAFGLSVHNAVAALYSIARGSRANYQSIAAGEATVETAIVEACGLLADGAEEVRVVVYDAPLPEIYAAFQQEVDVSYAWCWRIRPATGGAGDCSLSWAATDETSGRKTASDMPHGLSLMQFLLSDGPVVRDLVDGPTHWRWTRHV